ncbi:helix-turn-helix domain-containing protein [Chitinivibrio alkaliphilus]|uniref:Transcriptional regulator, AraC family n=1 Tax=Chitinivibrio alkaliphilus ACht1 TaxID=1313304 RepID=U7DDU0_9BACT|nr:helix-turn-helix transcriptional regulator [Chitinivibrio alkaliphilus]ERP39066.1 transcriptional regulator, AraC family [Chitinivibrio alkaliphilus ACht1]
MIKKNFLQNKTYARFLAIAGILMAVISTVHFFVHPLEIIPGVTPLEIESYADSDDYAEGSSAVLDIQKNPGYLGMLYRIGEERQFPYAGIALSRPDTSFWDLTRYDRVRIHVNPEMSAPFTLLCATMVEGFSTSDAALTWRLFQEDISDVSVEIDLSLSDLRTPVWWFQENRIPQNRNRESLGRVRQIRFQSHPQTPRNAPMRLHIEKIRFYRSFHGYLLWWGVSALLILPLLVSRHRKKSVLSYTPLDVSSQLAEDLGIIEEYLGREYSRLDMSLQRAIGETGLSEKRIRTVLQKGRGMGFKEYLDTLRIEEAARLLRETDRQINEIALYTGYRHPTTFTKIFRRFHGCSPREYRQKNSS